MQKWRLIVSKPASGALNMAIDEAILKSVSLGGKPTLRIYAWNPPTVSLGYFQDIDDINAEICNNLGYGIVRRLTGGRAVLHYDEATYSIIVPEENPLIPKGVGESYKEISLCLVNAIQNLGLKAVIEPVHRSKTSQWRQNNSSACFNAISWHEITVNGKKIVGSAQVRKDGCLLQHGSIPITLDSNKLFSVLKFSKDEIKERSCRFFKEKATSLQAEKKGEVNFSEVSDALIDGFSQTWPICLERESLSNYEKELVKKLERTKYSQDFWNYCKQSQMPLNG